MLASFHEKFSLKFPYFFRRMFWTGEQTPQTFSLFGCMIIWGSYSVGLEYPTKGETKCREIYNIGKVIRWVPPLRVSHKRGTPPLRGVTVMGIALFAFYASPSFLISLSWNREMKLAWVQKKWAQ